MLLPKQRREQFDILIVRSQPSTEVSDQNLLPSQGDRVPGSKRGGGDACLPSHLLICVKKIYPGNYEGTVFDRYPEDTRFPHRDVSGYSNQERIWEQYNRVTWFV